MMRRRHEQAHHSGRNSHAERVVHQRPSDSPGYVTLLLILPVGTTQAAEPVVAETDGVRQELLLHGQREFDVPAHSRVSFADGSVFQTDS